MLHFKGHPIHTVVIHIPISCYILSFLLDITGERMEIVQAPLFSFYLLASACIVSVIAILTGLTDMLSIKNERPFRIAMWHGILNLIWFSVFSFFVLRDLNDYPFIKPPDLFQKTLKGLCIAGLFFSDYLGGELIYKYNIFRKDTN
jgi:uncharacterized membrane protein